MNKIEQNIINDVYSKLNELSSKNDFVDEIKKTKSIDEVFNVISNFDKTIEKYDFYLFLEKHLENKGDVSDSISGGKLNFKQVMAGSLASLTLALSGAGINKQFKGSGVSFPSFSQTAKAASVAIVSKPPYECAEVIKKLAEDSKQEFEGEQFKLMLAQYGLTEALEKEPETDYNRKQKQLFSSIKEVYRLFSSLPENSCDKNKWNKVVRRAPYSGADNIAKREFDLTNPREVAMKKYFYDVLVPMNPTKSHSALVNDPTIISHLDDFGSFYQQSFVSELGGRVSIVQGSQRMRDIISEAVAQKVSGQFNEIKNWVLEHKLLVAGAGGLLIFKPAKDLVKSVFYGTRSAIDKFRREFLYSRLKYSSNPEEMLSILENSLNKVILNQEEAIRTVSSKIVGWLMAKNTDKVKKEIGSLLFTFLGSSGLGKTLFCRQLSIGIFGREMQEWQFVANSAVKGEENGITPADRLFNQDSKLVLNLSKNPECIIFLDEVDKWNINDPKGTILERLRDCKDTGKLMIRKKDGTYYYIDVSKTIFILTSNEHNHCWGVADTDLRPDPTRTEIKRDISLTRRFDIVEFKRFNSAGYMKILSPHLESLVSESLKKYSISIKYSDDFLKKLSEECELKDKGARGCNDLIVELCGQIVIAKSEAIKNKKVLRNAIIDFKDHNFVIKDENEKEENEPSQPDITDIIDLNPVNENDEEEEDPLIIEATDERDKK